MDEISKLFASGGPAAVVAAVLWYLLTKVTPKLDESQQITRAILDDFKEKISRRMLAVEAAADRNATATSLRIIATPQIIPEIKDKASEILEAAKIAESERSK